jgi:hypothetical protein
MKRILAAILAAMMLLTTAVACTDNGDTPDTPDTQTPDEGNTETPDEDTPQTPDESNGIIAPTVDAGTLGETMWNAFQDAITANSAVSMEELANTLITNPVIQFFGGAMPIEVGAEFFSGFGEYKITGYESAAMFAPMMGSIAFVGYVFDLAEGTDVNAFIKGLTDNADPRWNICVTADQTVVGAIQDKVFFLMCPASMGDGSEEGGNMGPVGAPEVHYPATLEEGTIGYSFWVSFEDMMIEGVNTTPAEIANALCMAELVPIGLGSMEVAPGLLAGFDNYEVTDFSSGAVFMPMIGAVPFVGYIFQLEEGVDVINFVNDLTANANTRWNICVEADEKLVGAYNNMVFFLMCPAQ